MDFADVVQHFSESVVPERLKQRADVSSTLSKKEVSREGPPNRKLFLRMRYAQYLINPQLALRVEGEWRRIYDLLSLERLAWELQDPVVWAGQVFDIHERRQVAIDGLRTQIKDLSTGGALPPELF